MMNYYWNVLGGWDANKMNILETSEEYIIYLRATGLKKEDIKLSIIGDTLTVKSEKEEDSAKYLRHEFWDDILNLNLSLPAGIDTENPEATLENGILKVTLKKGNSGKKMIEIS